MLNIAMTVLRWRDNSPYTKDTLKSCPGDGSTKCLSRCRCFLDIRQTGEMPEPGMQAVRAIETKRPRISRASGCPTWEEYEKLSQWDD